jgi:hypothetical protein
MVTGGTRPRDRDRGLPHYQSHLGNKLSEFLPSALYERLLQCSLATA